MTDSLFHLLKWRINPNQLSLKRWIEAIIFRMQGQFLKKFNDIVIPNILVMVSDQEICTILFLHGFYRVIDGLMVPI